MFPIECNEGLPYPIWCELYGKYRWYHEDGTPRTQYPLNYEWKTIYDIATNTADIAFNYRVIYDIDMFTNDFLSNVPINWMKYKTALEMFSGTLDGTNIDPLMFEAGFTRDTTQNENNNGNYNIDSNTNGTYTDNMGAQSGTEHNTIDNKTRNIVYEQGVQAYDNKITNDDIGELGNDYANTMQDTINLQDSNTQRNESAYTNTGNNGATTNTDGSNTNTRSFAEHIHETRINYYDNLAFLRERMDRLNLLKPFQSYFEPYFINVISYKGWWQ